MEHNDDSASPHRGIRLSDESELREYLWLLWVRKASILAVMAVAVGAALLYSSGQPEVFTSSAEVLVRPVNLDPKARGNIAAFMNLEPERRVATSNEVSELAAKDLGDVGAPASISVNAPQESNTLVFTSSSVFPLAAQRTAQAYAESYLRFRLQEVLDELRDASRPLEQRIAELNVQIEDVQRTLSGAETESQRTALQIRFNSLFSQRAFLEQRRNDLILPENLQVGRLLHPAALPFAPSGPKRGRTVILALFIGSAFGVGQAIVRARFDPRLQGRRDLSLGAGAPVLAVIPKLPSGDGQAEHRLVTVISPRSPEAEAYRALRATILFAISVHGTKSLVVTSATAGEGKTSTAANLGVALAQAGKRVILVSADLHRPALDAYFSHQNDVGLSNVLAGERKALDALRTSIVPGLRILRCGQPGAVPPELLASETMRSTLDDLKEEADLVILDTPPVLTAADTLAMTPLIDAVLLVAAAERTTCAAFDEARLRLEQVGAHVIGAVLNNVDRARVRFDQRYDRHILSSADHGWSA